MECSDLLIIGAGISGLSLAREASRAGRTVTVLEQEATAGGCMRTHRTDDGFWVELGAHTCYNSYGGLLRLIEDCLGLDQLLPRNKVPFRLLVDGELQKVTKQLGIFELLRSAPRLLVTNKQGLSVREYYSRIVGKRNYERVFGRLFAAVPSQNADEFPADMLFKKRPRRKEVLRSFTVAGGLQSIIDALAVLPKVEVSTNSRVTAVQRADHGFTVTTHGGAVHHAKQLALAAPPAIGAELMRASLPALAAALERIASVQIDTTAVTVRKSQLSLEPFAGIIPLDQRYYSAVSRDTVDHAEYRGVAVHFPVGTTEQQRLTAIGETLGVPTSQLEAPFSRSVSMPSPKVGHSEITAAIDQAIAAEPVYVTGNYFDGLSIEDCVQRSLREGARLAAR